MLAEADLLLVFKIVRVVALEQHDEHLHKGYEQQHDARSDLCGLLHAIAIVHVIDENRTDDGGKSHQNGLAAGKGVDVYKLALILHESQACNGAVRRVDVIQHFLRDHRSCRFVLRHHRTGGDAAFAIRTRQ